MGFQDRAYRISIKIPDMIFVCIWGSKAICGSIITDNWNGKGQKLRSNIKIHGELVILNFHFPENQNVFIFWFGTMTPETSILDCGSTKLF